MRKLKYIQFALLIGLLSLTSCKKYFEGVNDDPNRPSEVSANTLLPTIQTFYAYGMAGDISRFTSLLTNQIVGNDRQFATYQVYSITETDTDNWWKFNHYGGAMFDIKNLIDGAEPKLQIHYVGIAKIMMAYGLMTATDLLGDIPYTEAFKGLDNLTPKYDSQQAIYASIQTLLTEGKADLAEPELSTLEPGSDDRVYGGNLAKWTKLANVLSARAYLHLGKVDPANYTMALSALAAGGFSDAGDDAVFNFGTDYTFSSPWFQYNDQRADIVFEGFVIDTMTTMGDPRLDTYYFDGWLGEYFTSPTSPYFFASYMEQKFIEAEAKFQTGDLPGAATAHNEGVLASLARYGVTDSLFIANEASHTGSTITLEKIMVQKYIAMYLDPEVFTDWRRTGFPRLVPNEGNITGDVIPRRLPYPQSERFFNGANVPAIGTITSRVWWDI